MFARGWLLITGAAARLRDRRRQVPAAEAGDSDLSELLQAVGDSVLAHMAVLDRDGVITHVNAAWQQYARANAPESGLRDESAAGNGIGARYLDVCRSASGPGSEDAAKVAEGIAAVLNGERALFTLDYPCHGPDAFRWFQMTVTPLRTRAGGAVVVHSDITETRRNATELYRHRHHLEALVAERTAQLERANAELVLSRDRAQSANRAKSAFLANMSHELRTPMNAIIGLCFLMQRSGEDKGQAGRLAKVSAAANQLLEIINDILDFSKIEAGELALTMAGFSLADLLNRCRAEVAESAAAKGLSLELHADGVPDALHGDARRLLQALLNLASNAVKFTNTGSAQVRVELLGREATGLHLRFVVRDTGIGIADDQRGQLFTAFVQADASTTRRYGGTGLGLAITHRLAGLMGGEVGVSSALGVGSEFWFSARLEEAATAPAASPARRVPGPAQVQPAGGLAVEAPGAVPTRRDASGDGWEVLDRLLAVGDYEAIKLFGTLARGLAERHPDVVREVEAMLQRFDFDSARTTLHRRGVLPGL